MLKTTDPRSDNSKHITRATRAIPRRSQNSRMTSQARHLNEARCRTVAASCAVFRSHSGLKHRELDHTVFDLATRESGTSDPLELGTMSVKIAEGLICVRNVAWSRHTWRTEPIASTKSIACPLHRASEARSGYSWA
jgi:hypothetical protein